jgi:N-acetylneuraminate synthase
MTYIIAEIGINHDGDLDKACMLMMAAADAGVDAVKFQKRNPEKAVPMYMWDVQKETPWGETMDYIDYKRRMEFGWNEYLKINSLANELKIDWSASAWDTDSVNFMARFKTRIPWIKIPSAKITDMDLLKAVREHFPTKEVIMSTGMSTREEIIKAIQVLGKPITVMHCNSQYPAPVEDLNLTAILELKDILESLYGDSSGWRVGYSGHEVGLATTVAAVALGAEVVERHITLDRSSVGTDHASSVEPVGFRGLVKDIHNVGRALGHGELGPSDGELDIRRKLRG